LLIEDRALPVVVPEAIEATAASVEPAGEKTWSERPQAATLTEAETVPAQPRPKPAIFVPARPPDDPGVAQAETEDAPNSLERLRTAQIR
jgi:hypothetical protein